MSPTGALWRALIHFDPQKIQPEVAIRNTLGFACAVILGTVFGSVSTGVVAGLGALNVSYSDGRDPYALRARRMLISTLLCSAAVTLGAISAHSNIAAVVTATIWAFAAGMLIALGPAAGDIGVITLVTLVVFAARPLPPLEALQAGMVACGGGALQTLFSTFLWPIRPYAPERRIIAGVYSELAKIAAEAPREAQSPPMTAQISDALDAFASLARDHRMEAERHVFLLLEAERIRLSVLSTARFQRRIARNEEGASAAGALGEILEQASFALGAIARCVENDAAAGPALEKLTAVAASLRAQPIPPSSAFFTALVRDARQQADALCSQIRAAAGSGDNPQTDTDPLHDEPWRLRFQSWRARLLANLSLDSTVFRHAVRLAVCLAIGDAIGRGLSVQRTYWIPMTIAIVLKPDFTGTFARGVLRIGGTLAGLALATVVFHFAPHGIVTGILLMTLFTLLMRWAGPANYGIFVIAISGLVVLLISVTGVAPSAVIAARAMNTTIGGTLALLAYAVWPTWEKTQTRAALADMLDAYRAYFDAVAAARQGQPPAAIQPVRLRARRARSNAEASVDRLSGEPGITPQQINCVNAILVQSHHFVHAAMAIESRLYRERRDPPPAWMAGIAAWADNALAGIAEALRNPSPAAIAGLRHFRDNANFEGDADDIRSSLQSLADGAAKCGWL